MARGASRAHDLVTNFTTIAIVADKAQPEDLIRALLEVAATMAIREGSTDGFLDQLYTMQEYLEDREPD